MSQSESIALEPGPVTHLALDYKETFVMTDEEFLRTVCDDIIARTAPTVAIVTKMGVLHSSLTNSSEADRRFVGQEDTAFLGYTKLHPAESSP